MISFFIGKPGALRGRQPPWSLPDGVVTVLGVDCELVAGCGRWGQEETQEVGGGSGPPSSHVALICPPSWKSGTFPGHT